MHEIQAALPPQDASAPQFNRRVRELREAFIVEGSRNSKGWYVYKLRGTRAEPKADAGISKTLRSYVLRNQRCEMCGRTPKDDGVRLHVDHKIPREWGGTSDAKNLQALCSECNEGKRDRFSSFDGYGKAFARAAAFSSPHKRIGELLKDLAPKEVPAELIELVASAQQYQGDWSRRLRELRVLGWVLQPRRQTVDGRVLVFWSLKHWEPWPPGDPAAEVRRRSPTKRKQGRSH